MRLRRAVLQSPAKPPVPPGLPLYKNRHSLTRPESTLLQLLIPLHFISFISNTYKKPGGGTPSSTSKVCQLVTPSSKFVIPSEARNLLFPPSVALSLPHYLFTSPASGPTHKLPQPQSPLCFTSQFPVYPWGRSTAPSPPVIPSGARDLLLLSSLSGRRFSLATASNLTAQGARITGHGARFTKRLPRASGFSAFLSSARIATGTCPAATPPPGSKRTNRSALSARTPC